MALRNVPKYIQQRFANAANDPVWHWSQLFRGISPDGFVMHDLDAEGEYRGHHLFIEAKVIGEWMARSQITRLTKLAANPKHSVLLVGLTASVDAEFRTSWREACWVWVGNPKWRDPKSVTFGSVAEFRAMMREWFRRIEALADFEEHTPKWVQQQLFAA